MTYKLSGPLDDPEIAINPLSVLAPGFLRDLFKPEIEKPDDEQPDDESIR